MGLHFLSTSFIDRPFLKMIYLSMVYQYFAQATSENHHLVRTCYLIVLFVLMWPAALDFALTIKLRAFRSGSYIIVRSSTLPLSSLS